MVKVTGPTAPGGPTSTAPTEPATGAAKPTAPSTPMADDGLSKATSGLLGYKSSPLVSGAIKIFGDGVVFPQNLLDTKDPRNDPKYLRLLAAVLGMDELERHFYSLEGKKQEEYLAHKTKQREEKWAKVKREKEEKEGRKQQAASEEEEDSSDES